MLTHRSCWASPSFCRHWCLSASQWSSSQRNCPGNSDRRGGRVEETMHGIKIQLLKLVEDHCKVYLQTFRQQRASENNHQIHGSLLWVFIPAAMAECRWVSGLSLGHCWRIQSSPVNASSDLQTPAKSHWPGQGEDKDKNIWNGWVSARFHSLLCLCMCAAVWVCGGSAALKTKSNSLKIETTLEDGGAYKCVHSPCDSVFLVYHIALRLEKWLFPRGGRNSSNKKLCTKKNLTDSDEGFLWI